MDVLLKSATEPPRKCSHRGGIEGLHRNRITGGGVERLASGSGQGQELPRPNKSEQYFWQSSRNRLLFGHARKAPGRQTLPASSSALRMKRYLPFLIVTLVALLTIGSAVALYRAYRLPTPTASKDPGESKLHVRGDAKAPVTIEEFGDFECPPCAMMSVALHQLEKEYGSKLRVIFRQFPLAMHPHAREAAIASEAAHLQGKFWEMHDLLYEKQAQWSKSTDVPSLFHSFAATLGLDVERFKKDMQSPEIAARVTADQEQGRARGVTSTPTIFVNDTALPSKSTNPPGVRAAIDAALKETPKP
jgi:protein-disulfide isomerase